MDVPSLQDLIAGIQERQHIYDDLKFDETYPHMLGSPASQAALERLAGLLGRELPTDYRCFLQHWNGWTDFDGDGNLLAAEDHEARWVKERVAEWCSLWDPDTDNPFTAGALPVMLGETKNSFVVLDPRRSNGNGECELVLYDYMVEEEAFESFVAYLQRRYDILGRLIDREQNGVDDDEAEGADEGGLP